MNKALKRFKRVKWIDTELARKYKFRRALNHAHVLAIKSMAQLKIDTIRNSNDNLFEKQLAVNVVRRDAREAISKLV